jgi:hypothetical protein
LSLPRIQACAIISAANRKIKSHLDRLDRILAGSGK